LTLFQFWLVSNGTVEESQTAVAHPTDAGIVSELSSKYGVRTSVYQSSVWYDLAYSFGVYVDGKVFRQDLDQFQTRLNAYWNDTGTGYFVKFLFPEMYFRANAYVTVYVNYGIVSVFKL